MLIDTHCHLDFAAFDHDRQRVLAASRAVGVKAIVVPAVYPDNFSSVRQLATDEPDVGYALGLHPLFLKHCPPDAIALLHAAVERAKDDPKLVAIGEIGLDFFVNDVEPAWQEDRLKDQLLIAREYDLPVLIHCRRALDRLLSALRRTRVVGGIIHAFNGSAQQASQLIELGFCLGFGGALTFDKARRIRRCVSELPASAHVLETDAPDMAPHWLGRTRNQPAQLAAIAEQFAMLRQLSDTQVAEQTGNNACRVLPRLGALVTA